VFGSIKQHRTVVGSEESNFEAPACRNMRFGAEELNGVESSELAATEQWQERSQALEIRLNV
jgi:hypothetical protein